MKLLATYRPVRVAGFFDEEDQSQNPYRSPHMPPVVRPSKDQSQEAPLGIPIEEGDESIPVMGPADRQDDEVPVGIPLRRGIAKKVSGTVLVLELPDLPMDGESEVEDSHSEMSELLDFEDLSEFMAPEEMEAPVGLCGFRQEGRSGSRRCSVAVGIRQA